LLTPGKSLAFAFLPDGLDPDDLLRQQGAEAVARALVAPKPLVDVLWAKELAAGNWTTPERRAQLEKRLHELMGTIADKTVRQYYEQETRRRLREQFNGYRSSFGGASGASAAANWQGRTKLRPLNSPVFSSIYRLGSEGSQRPASFASLRRSRRRWPVLTVQTAANCALRRPRNTESRGKPRGSAAQSRDPKHPRATKRQRGREQMLATP